MSEDPLTILRCPHCAREKEGRLHKTSDGAWLVCEEAGCDRRYPIYKGLPIMLTKEGDFLGFLKRIGVEG